MIFSGCQRIHHTTNVMENLSVSVGQTFATVPMWKIGLTTVIGWGRGGLGLRGFRWGELGLGVEVGRLGSVGGGVGGLRVRGVEIGGLRLGG